MQNFMVQETNGKAHVVKDIVDGEEGLRIFGESPDHYYPMKIINAYLGEEVLRLSGAGLMIHLFLPEKHMDLWSKKIGERDDLQTEHGTGFRLDKMKNET